MFVLGALVGALPDFLPANIAYALFLEWEIPANITIGATVILTLLLVTGLLGGLTGAIYYFTGFNFCDTIASLIIVFQ